MLVFRQHILKMYELEYLDIEENVKYEETIEKVIEKCFEVEKINHLNFYLSIILTNPENIQKINKQYRNIDKETDVLSFPMFEKEEIEKIKEKKAHICEEPLGDIIISIDKVRRQAIEYEHSFERELAYMVVHGFYHLMGYDHIKEEDKKIMRQKEENILQKLNIVK